MSYTIAWLVIVVAGLLGSGFLIVMTRGIKSPGFRWILRVLPLVLMVAPAPVPNYDGQLAPAFVVLIFESLFQNHGEPGVAAMILLAAALAGIALGLFIGRLAGPAVSKPAGEE